MLSVAIGAEIYELIIKNYSEEFSAIIICFISSLSMLFSSIFHDNFYILLICFLIFEACVGAFEPCSATCRSKYIENGRMGSTLTLFRLPLNGIVVMGTKLTELIDRKNVFIFCSIILFLSFISHIYLYWKKNKTQNSLIFILILIVILK